MAGKGQSAKNRKQKKRSGNADNLEDHGLDLAQNVQQTLRDRPSEPITSKSIAEMSSRIASLQSATNLDPMSSAAQGKQQYQRQSLQDSILPLLEQDYQKKFVALLKQCRSLSINQETLQRLRAWMSCPESKDLWMIDHNSASWPSTASQIAGFIANRAILDSFSGRVTVITHSCPSSSNLCDKHGEPRYAFYQLLLSIIVQLLASLPDTFQSEADFSEQRFNSLHDTSIRLSSSISLIKDLLPLQQKKVICIVIDGLQSLSVDPGIDLQITILVQMLQSLPGCRSLEQGKVVKTLYSTDGLCKGLSILSEECFDLKKIKRGSGGKAVDSLGVLSFEQLLNLSGAQGK